MASLHSLTVLVLHFVLAAPLKRATMELYTLVSDFDGKIYSYSMNDSSLRRIPISDNGQGPEALDYDPYDVKFYWTNIRADTIKRARLDGSDEETVLRAVETPRGIVVDYINRLLFYTEEKIDIIGSVNLTSSVQKTIIRTGLDRPLAITVNMEKKIVYWTDIGSPAKIEQANYDGTGRKVLVSNDLKWPIALALDDTKENLFWCDGNKKKIQYINVTSGEITVVIYKTGTHYYDLNWVDGTIFFIDLLQRNKFSTIPATGGSVTTYNFGKVMSKWRKLRVVKVLVCDDMTWGANCTNNCGHCLHDAVCDKFNGRCPSGCEIGFEGSTCDNVCRNGTFGAGCRSICGHCSDAYTCDSVTGLCEFGCAAGWDGTYCSEECSDGQHGFKCEDRCGNCLRNQSCDKESGNCTSGCEAGWMGASCKDECSMGTFGINCQYQCQCAKGADCDKLTGECPRVVKPVRICSDYTYGPDCMIECGHCLNGQSCNESSGDCPLGCDVGWAGVKCDSECPLGWYGESCHQICRCDPSQTCDSFSGRCYYPTTLTPQKQVGRAVLIDTPVTTALSVIIVILVIMLAIALFFIYRRKRLDRQASSSRESLSTEKSFSVSFSTPKAPLIN